MIPEDFQYNGFAKVLESIIRDGAKDFSKIVEAFLNQAMKIERENVLGAGPYERTEARTGYANGFKERTFYSRGGPLELNIPQTRGVAFYPSCLEKGCRSERALKLAIAEMYVQGVSTAKVRKITEELCGLEVSSTQVSHLSSILDTELEAFRTRPLGRFKHIIVDAIYTKTRHGGSVIDLATLIAVGVNAEGKREVLGLSVSLSEAEVHWRSFFESLQKRGLNGLELIISDDHTGLKAARRAVFPSIPWQRCIFHMSQNAQEYTPKKELKTEIGQSMREIFNCPTLEQARSHKAQIALRYEKSAPKFVQWLEDNIEEGLTFFNFPAEHRKKLRTSNLIERLNQEIRRRIRVVRIFPNEKSCERLVTALLQEIHEDWLTGPVYLKMNV